MYSNSTRMCQHHNMYKTQIQSEQIATAIHFALLRRALDSSFIVDPSCSCSESVARARSATRIELRVRRLCSKVVDAARSDVRLMGVLTSIRGGEMLAATLPMSTAGAAPGIPDEGKETRSDLLLDCVCKISAVVVWRRARPWACSILRIVRSSTSLSSCIGGGIALFLDGQPRKCFACSVSTIHIPILQAGVADQMCRRRHIGQLETYACLSCACLVYA